jgi:putative FmdB family regulatory protein
MPRYDFRCTACAHSFEKELPFGSKETLQCPACGSLKVEKIISAPGILFKGTGFYATDSRAPVKETKESTKESPAEKKEQKPEKVAEKKVNDKNK